MTTKRKQLIKKQLITAIQNGDEALALSLLQQCSGNRRHIISLAARFGHKTIVTQLMDEQLLQAEYDTNLHPLTQAAYGGHEKIVQLLLPLSPTSKIEEAVIGLTKTNKIKMLDVLLPLCERVSYQCLAFAAAYGNMEAARQLLPYSDPKIYNSHALAVAAEHGQHDMFDFLYPLSEPENALRYLKSHDHNLDQKAIDMIEQRMKADEEREIIGQALGGSEKSSTKRKM